MRRNSVQTADLASDLLKGIRIGNGISRAELARSLGLSGSTAGVYVERLMADGFLTESAGVSRDAGRPPKLLHLNPNGGEFVGVDFEASNILAAAVDFAEKPLRYAHQIIEEGDSVAKIVQKIQEAVAEVSPRVPGRLLAIGIGVPGVVDAAQGTSLRYEYLPHWQNVPLAALVQKRFTVPVFLENTMRAMALAEMWFGQGRGCADFVCICIRSGMGAGIVSSGGLHRGGHQEAGELGHCRCLPVRASLAAFFPARSSGPQELQDIVSARSIRLALQKGVAMGRRTVLRGASQLPSLEEVVAAARQQDLLTLQILEQAADSLGGALANLVLTVDPLKIILAGQLAPLGDTFLKPLRHSVAQALVGSGREAPAIVHSSMGEYVGALGAAALALHQWKPAREDWPGPKG